MNTRFKSKAILMALNLPFSSGGNACWFPQTGAAFHGGSAAQSGAISDGQRTWLQTTVTGPGTLKFYWKVSCEADKDSDYLDFSIDGVQQKVIYGETSWAQQTYNISPRKHTLTWSYEKDNSLSYGTDAGWVDKVEWAESTAHLSAALAIAPSTVTPFVGQDFTISGALTAEGVGVASETVTLQRSTDGINFIDVSTAVTKSGGTFAFTAHVSEGGAYHYKVIYDGSSAYTWCESKPVAITALRVPTAITIHPTELRKVPAGRKYSFNGLLTVNGAGLANTPVALKRSTDNCVWSTVSTTVTDSTGNYALTESETVQTLYYYKASYEGNAMYAPSNSPVTQVAVKKPAEDQHHHHQREREVQLCRA